jgi:hypothetical protein
MKQHAGVGTRDSGEGSLYLKRLFSISRILRPASRVFLLVLMMAAPARAAQSVESLFQKALMRETVQRDSEGAIHLYQQVIDQAGGNRSLKAEARLRTGICYEKLDKPLEAEQYYRLVLSEPSNVSPDILEQATNNLNRIEAERRNVRGSTSPYREQWTHRYVPSQNSFSLGPTLLAANSATPAYGLSLGLRLRPTHIDKYGKWFVEAGGIIPFGNAEIADQSREFDSQGADVANLTLRYQISLGLVNELPHGKQRTAIPEVGAGFALTSSRISYRTASSAGESTENAWSPYLEGGLHIYPDRIFSYLLQARFVNTPYPKSVEIASPAHTQNFDFPSSQWSIGVMVQMKLGRVVQEPK